MVQTVWGKKTIWPGRWALKLLCRKLSVKVHVKLDKRPSPAEATVMVIGP